MACNSCAKPYSLLRREKGCPGCGFSYCSKCLDNKAFIKKLNSEAKVCRKCKQATDSSTSKQIAPPDAYFKRAGVIKDNVSDGNIEANKQNEEIMNRLSKLKEGRDVNVEPDKLDNIEERLKDLKGERPSTSDQELQERLAKLRGFPTTSAKAVTTALDLRTDHDKANDLLNQYMMQTKIDTEYKNEFDALINNIESRLTKLKGSEQPPDSKNDERQPLEDSVDEEEAMRKIIERVKAESLLEDEISASASHELPFCEICNEDAKMRCLGCKYLFCKRCFIEHKDDDDGCNRYEPFTLPKTVY